MRHILLFGMPRSGTTWLGKLFDAQRQTHYLHEPDSVDANYNIPLLLKPSDPEVALLTTQLPKWFENTAEKVIASRPFFNKSYQNPLSWSLFLLTAYGTKALGKVGLSSLIKPVRLQNQQARLVWKSIESLGRISAIKYILPCYSIHIIRHPCGHIASTLKGQDAGLFDGSLPVWEDWDLFQKLLSQSKESRFTLEMVKQMTPEERLALRWGIINDFAIAQAKDDRTNMVLVYEQLCKQPEAVLRKCMEFCNLIPDEQVFAYLRQSTGGAEDSSYYSTVKNPLQSAYKWRKHLSADSQLKIKQIVQQFTASKYYIDDF